jgi:hypothetical protein
LVLRRGTVRMSWPAEEHLQHRWLQAHGDDLAGEAPAS